MEEKGGKGGGGKGESPTGSPSAPPPRYVGSTGAGEGAEGWHVVNPPYASAKKAEVAAPTTPIGITGPAPPRSVGSTGAEGTGAVESSVEEARMRSCRECGSRHHWRKMKVTYVPQELTPEEKARVGTSAERDDILAGRHAIKHEHTCERCWAAFLDVTEVEARRDIKRVRSIKDLERAKTYIAARRDVKSSFEFLGVARDAEGPQSKRQYKAELRKRVKMKIETLADFFAPVLDVLKAKAEDEAAAAAAAQRLATWLHTLPAPGTSGDRDEAEGARLEDALATATGVTRAFADHGMDQKEFYRAADYTDE